MDVMELGTGTGSTPLTLLDKKMLRTYVGNDFSPEVTAFYQGYTFQRLAAAGIPTKFFSVPCCDCPLSESADLFLVGVYYEAQPDLFLRRGLDISAMLGKSGVLVVQSGKPENRFITDLLTEEPSAGRCWPWYAEGFSLRKRFRYIAVCNVHDETMILGSSSALSIDSLLEFLSTTSNTSHLR